MNDSRAVLDKLDGMKDDLTEIKVRLAVVENRLDTNKESNIPQRINDLELFQQRVKVLGGVAMIIVPSLVTVLLRKWIG